MELHWIKNQILDGNYFLSKHADLERQNDNLRISDIEEVLMSGVSLENYSDTGRGESCLVAGFTKMGIPVHVVCGEKDEHLIIVTIYIPSPPKFKTIYERGN